MRRIQLLICCLLMSSCNWFGIRAVELPPGNGYGFDTTDTNVLLYMVSIVGVAAGVAMVIWTPLKTVGGFIATMFGGIIILISVFAALVKIMPWIVGGCCLIAVGLAVIYFRKHWNSVADVINTHIDPEKLDIKAKRIVDDFKRAAVKGDPNAGK